MLTMKKSGKFLNSKISPEGKADPASDKLPRHIAIIMDGNGRWARQRSLDRLEGHRQGVEAIERALQACRNLKIPYLTLYAFSTENWQRPEKEVAGIMELLKYFLSTKKEKLQLRVFECGDARREVTCFTVHQKQEKMQRIHTHTPCIRVRGRAEGRIYISGSG